MSWTPDGRSILFSANLVARTGSASRSTAKSTAISIDGGAPVALTDREGPDNSPGGFARRPAHRLRRLRRPAARLPEHPALRDEPRRFGQARADRPASTARSASPAWAADGRSIYVQVEDARQQQGRARRARRLDPRSRHRADRRRARPALHRRRVQRRRGTARSRVTVGDPLHPSDIGDRVGRRRSARLTHLNAASGGQGARQGRRSSPVTSSFDQRPIDAWMVTPPDFDPAKKYPLILEIHGGPFAAYGPQLLDRRPALRRRRLCRALRQPARLDLLRRGVRQPDRQGLSRPRL